MRDQDEYQTKLAGMIRGRISDDTESRPLRKRIRQKPEKYRKISGK